ncbi:MAG: hypothetical protein AAF657_31085 [Acidobacteriota bacterium]
MTRPQQQRALIVLAAVLVLTVLARQVLRRGGVLEPTHSDRPVAQTAASPATGPAANRPFAAAQLDQGARGEMLQVARQLLMGADAIPVEDRGEPGRRLVVLSLGRAQRTAWVAHGAGQSLHQALAQAAGALARRATPADLQGGRLKVDIVVDIGSPQRFTAEGHSDLDRSLDGVWLPDSDVLLLPEEVLSRRLVNSDGELRPKRIAAYLRERGDRPPDLDAEGQPGARYQRVRFDSLIEGDDRSPTALWRGNPRSPAVSPEALMGAAVAGGDYLLRHHRDDGDFGYSYEAKKDTYNDSYNLLRHAGTCYALGQLSRATGDTRYLQAARRGIEALLERAAPPKPEHASAGFEAIVSPGQEAKLGGAALAILAIVEHHLASGEADFDRSPFAERARRLARFLVFQQEADGHFFSKYFYGKPDPVPFESIYYPGEAILALARLYRLDPQPEWLATSQRGADWLIGTRDADKAVADLPHDHWLLMGLDELDQLTGEPHYTQHAAKIAQAIVDAQRTGGEPADWVGSFYTPPRSTPTATRAEGLVAMHHLARRHDLDTTPFLTALERMATFQRRCQLTPENVLYLPRPDRALGGFRRSLTNWEVRIDYVQHNLSALLGLREILLDGSSMS